MAFTEKTKTGYVVKKGNSGEVLTRFSGKNAKKRADMEVAKLHKKNKPKSSSRGKSASKKFGKGAKKK
jgi:hypothetical protein